LFIRGHKNAARNGGLNCGIYRVWYQNPSGKRLDKEQS
jgi:hypothetical protein